jgi:hypothetical protein
MLFNSHYYRDLTLMDAAAVFSAEQWIYRRDRGFAAGADPAPCQLTFVCDTQKE